MSSAIAPRPLPRPGGAGGDTLKVALYPDEPTQVSRLLALAASAGSGETCRGQLRIVEAEEGNNLFFLEKDLSGNTFRGMLVCARYREGHVVELHAVQMIPKVPRATGVEPSPAGLQLFHMFIIHDIPVNTSQRCIGIKRCPPVSRQRCNYDDGHVQTAQRWRVVVMWCVQNPGGEMGNVS